MHYLLHPTLRAVFESSAVYDESGSVMPLDSNVSMDEALLLCSAVRHIKPTRSVEIGLAKGISTLAILGAIDANGFGHHTVCDPFQSDYGNAGVEMVRRAGLNHCWEFHQGRLKVCPRRSWRC
jgi:predicted O-methyltransferase YrrM